MCTGAWAVPGGARGAPGREDGSGVTDRECLPGVSVREHGGGIAYGLVILRPHTLGGGAWWGGGVSGANMVVGEGSIEGVWH